MPRSMGLQGHPLGAYASAATPVGTTITPIAGLSVPLPTAGKWRIEGWIPLVVVGLPTGFTLTLVGSASTSSMRVLVRRSDATSSWTDSYLTTLGSASTSSSLTAQTYLFNIDGAADIVGNGTVSVSMTRTGGTSATTQVGSFLIATRID